MVVVNDGGSVYSCRSGKVGGGYLTSLRVRAERLFCCGDFGLLVSEVLVFDAVECDYDGYYESESWYVVEVGRLDRIQVYFLRVV